MHFGRGKFTQLMWGLVHLRSPLSFGWRTRNAEQCQKRSTLVKFGGMHKFYIVASSYTTSKLFALACYQLWRLTTATK